jgi:O-6-methylguanine DNA methyltransferase
MLGGGHPKGQPIMQRGRELLTSPTVSWDRVATPVGTLLLTASSRGLAGIAFLEKDEDWKEAVPRRLREARLQASRAVLAPTRQWLESYFGGRRPQGIDYPAALDPGGTPFDRQVWAALRMISYGETRTYGEIARALGTPGAARAIGMASHRNPIAILIPCHRVIGAEGKLVGYGGGLWRKSQLLRLERGDDLFARLEGGAA